MTSSLEMIVSMRGSYVSMDARYIPFSIQGGVKILVVKSAAVYRFAASPILLREV